MKGLSWWELVVLALAAHRVTRLIGWDTITEPARQWVLALDRRILLRQGRVKQRRFREGDTWWIGKMIECPWCMGWWVSLAWWGAWEASSRWALIVAGPFALASAVGLIAKNLDP